MEAGGPDVAAALELVIAVLRSQRGA